MRKTVKWFLMVGGAGILLFGPVMACALASPNAESYCVGSGAEARCIVDNRPWNTEDGGAPWTITSARKGLDDLRFEVRGGDTAPWDAAHDHKAERAEISEFKQKEPLDTDIWFSFGLMVEPGPKVTSRWDVLGQLRATEDPGDMAASPVWAQELDDGDQFKILIRSKAEKPLRGNPSAKTLFVDSGFQRGHIYRFVYRLCYSQTRGRLRAWRDGRQIADYAGPLGYISEQGPYFKFGIYREPSPETLAVHYYNLRFGGPELEP